MQSQTNKRWGELTDTLRHKVPNGELRVQRLPQAPELQLALIADTYPQADLSVEQIEFLMDTPPYWAFCWASGQVMARYLLDHPEQVQGKTVLDFGCGSGVVAIAAKLAGARRAIALDIDPAALTASALNAELNRVDIDLRDQLTGVDIETRNTTMIIADVFYDRNNIPMLSSFIHEYADIIVADSRVKPSELTGVQEVSRYTGCTVPDLGESGDFNSVGIYRVCG